MAHVAEKVFDTLPRSLKRMTFLEGLAGAEADIDAVFELEEEFDSALDTADNNDDFSIQDQRRFSGASMRRGRPLPPSSPPKAVPGARITSTNRGIEAQSFSPLAQVFNPVVIEEDVMRDPNLSAGSLVPGISYGPATRRKMSSIQPSHRRLQPDPLLTQFQSNQPRRFHTTSVKNSPPERVFLRSRSQGHDTLDRAMTLVENKDREDDMGEGLEQSAIMKRLDDIEERQERIESLLHELSHTISNKKTI
jgi:hypothetical protein